MESKCGKMGQKYRILYVWVSVGFIVAGDIKSLQKRILQWCHAVRVAKWYKDYANAQTRYVIRSLPVLFYLLRYCVYDLHTQFILPGSSCLLVVAINLKITKYFARFPYCHWH